MSTISAGHAQDFLVSRAIQTTVNGVEVEGHSEAYFHNIKTTITQPFRDIYDCWHIPYFAQGHNSYHGEHGESMAQYSLINIYRVAEYVNRKEDMLKIKLDENRQQIERASVGRLTMDEFRSKRLELRRKLRARQMTNIEYQRRIGRMRTEAESLHHRIWHIEKQFWDGCFQTIINIGLRDSIVEILDGEKSLFSD